MDTLNPKTSKRESLVPGIRILIEFASKKFLAVGHERAFTNPRAGQAAKAAGINEHIARPLGWNTLAKALNRRLL